MRNINALFIALTVSTNAFSGPLNPSKECQDRIAKCFTTYSNESDESCPQRFKCINDLVETYRTEINKYQRSTPEWNELDGCGYNTALIKNGLAECKDK